MMVNFKNYLGEMPLEDKIRSIFDTMVAGNIADDGNYYCIHTDHKTHEKYALTREAEKQADMPIIFRRRNWNALPSKFSESRILMQPI